MYSVLTVVAALAAPAAQDADSSFLHALSEAASLVLTRIGSEDSVSAGGPLLFQASAASEVATTDLGRHISLTSVAQPLGRPHTEPGRDRVFRCAITGTGSTTNCRIREDGVRLDLMSVSERDSTITLVLGAEASRSLAPDSSEVLAVIYEVVFRKVPTGRPHLISATEIRRGVVIAKPGTMPKN